VPVVFGVNVLVLATATGESPFRGWPSPPPQAVGDCADWENNPILDLAAAVGAFLIVSADVDLTSMSPWRGRPIIEPSQFASLVDASRRARRHRDSVIVVRTESGIRAFHNSCRHRSMRLVSGSGCAARGTFRCPFHGWAYNLDGECTFVSLREEFGDDGMLADDLRLRSVEVGERWGFVFVNLDPDAGRLEEHLAPMGHLDHIGLENQRLYSYRWTELPCNWRVALDAFLEAYHVPTTHPQLVSDSGLMEYSTTDHGHSFYNSTYQSSAAMASDRRDVSSRDEADLFIETIDTLVDQLDGFVGTTESVIVNGLRHKPIPPGSSAKAEFAKAWLEHAGHAAYPLPETPLSERRYANSFVFPNLFMLVNMTGTMMYRARPNGDDPNSCIWDVLVTRFFTPGREPSVSREYVPVEDTGRWRLVLSQDYSNLANLTVGLRSRGARGFKLNRRQESGLMNLEREIDCYLKPTAPSVRRPGRSQDAARRFMGAPSTT
jgi:phenylpropionate dioxygenase-like ring-hydroxylating dioxygenase large terminal subunit